MAARIRLVATDLDGTIAGTPGQVSIYPAFATTVNRLRGTHNAVWTVVSGRSLRSVRRHLAGMLHRGIMPDFLILRHAYIYRLARFGYVPCLTWNLWILYLLVVRPIAGRRLLRNWYDEMVEEFPRISTMIRSPHRVRVRFASAEDALLAAAALRENLLPYRHVKLFVNGVEVDVRPVPYVKGLALSELSRHLGVVPSQVLAIGNGRNDLSMIDPQVARLCGCPANSDARIVDAVHKAGGHVAAQRSLAGVIEIIEAYQTDSVSSVLPEGWRPPTPEQSLLDRPAGNERGRRMAKRVLILGVVVYLIAVIFASFDAIPFGWIVMKPYDLLVSLVERITRGF